MIRNRKHLALLVGTLAGFSLVAPQTTQASWQGAANANWTATSSWTTMMVPNSSTDIALFANAAGANSPAVLNANQTVNALTFSSTNSYTLQPLAAQVLSLAGATPTITVTNIGTQTVAVALNLGNGTTISVNSGTLTLNAPTNSVIGTNVTATVFGGATLNLGGAGNALSDGTTHVNVTNAGTLAATTPGKQVGTIDGTGITKVTAANATLTANHIRQTGLDIGMTNTVTVATNGGNSGVSQVTNLTIGAGGKLDLKDNDLVVPTGSLTRAQVEMLVNSGALSNTGILTTSLTGITGLGTAEIGESAYASTGTYGGLSVTDADTLVKYTYLGDADLSGCVDFDDFALMDFGYYSGGNRWAQGDFDNDGLVGFDDYAYAGASYWAQGACLLTANISAVPEPSTCVLGGLSMLGLIGFKLRRRKIEG